MLKGIRSRLGGFQKQARATGVLDNVTFMSYSIEDEYVIIVSNERQNKFSLTQWAGYARVYTDTSLKAKEFVAGDDGFEMRFTKASNTSIQFQEGNTFIITQKK